MRNSDTPGLDRVQFDFVMLLETLLQTCPQAAWNFSSIVSSNARPLLSTVRDTQSTVDAATILQRMCCGTAAALQSFCRHFTRLTPFGPQITRHHRPV